MNYVPRSLLALLTLVSIVASLPAQGTTSPGASVTPKAAAIPTPRPSPIGLPDIVAEAGAGGMTNWWESIASPPQWRIGKQLAGAPRMLSGFAAKLTKGFALDVPTFSREAAL